MERIEAAFKSSIRKEMALKATPPVYEEFLTVPNGFTGDDLFVDDLLDLSNDDLLDLSNEDVFADEETEPNTQQDMMLCVSEPNVGDADLFPLSNEFSAFDDFGSLPTSELSVPTDDVADLEWLSTFVEDSFTAPNLTGIPVEKPVWLTGNRKHPVTPATEESCVKSPVTAKTRTKRYRNGVRAWSRSSSPSSGPTSSGSTSSSSSSGLSNPWFSGAELLEAPVHKRYKKRSTESVYKGELEMMQQTRQCSHCGVQKTPQWRAGPMGPKTLCNACGVRFKSGRLLPEYRPACSPTFSSELHSNHHRKVVEMRRKKEPSDDNQTGLNQMVQSPRAVRSF